MSGKSVGPVACTKPGRQVTQIPPAQHIAGNARQHGRTQSRGQAAHVRDSQSSGGSRQTGQSPAQPSPYPKSGQGLVSSDTFSDMPKAGPQEQSKITLCIKYCLLSSYQDVVIKPLIVKLMRVRVPGKASSPFWAGMGCKVGPKGPNFFCKLVGCHREGVALRATPPMATNPWGGGGGVGGIRRITEYKAAFMPLHYVLLFPRGELGWEPGIPLAQPHAPAGDQAPGRSLICSALPNFL